MNDTDARTTCARPGCNRPYSTGVRSKKFGHLCSHTCLVLCLRVDELRRISLKPSVDAEHQRLIDEWADRVDELEAAIVAVHRARTASLKHSQRAEARK